MTPFLLFKYVIAITAGLGIGSAIMIAAIAIVVSAVDDL